MNNMAKRIPEFQVSIVPQIFNLRHSPTELKSLERVKSRLNDFAVRLETISDSPELVFDFQAQHKLKIILADLREIDSIFILFEDLDEQSKQIALVDIELQLSFVEIKLKRTENYYLDNLSY